MGKFENFERRALKSSSFSETDFTQCVIEFLNDTEVVGTEIKTSADAVTVIETLPAVKFRKMIMSVLVDFGVDKKDAEKVLTQDYQFKKAQLSDMYSIISELLYRYMKGGKKFKIAKEDVITDFWLEKVDAVEDEECRGIGSGPISERPITGYKDVAAHYKSKTKSKVPGHMIVKKDTNKKVIKNIALKRKKIGAEEAVEEK